MLRIEIGYLPIDDGRALARDRDSNRQAGRHFARLADDPVKAGNGGIEPPPRGLYCGLDARPPAKKHDLPLFGRSGSEGGAGDRWEELCHDLVHAWQRTNWLDIDSYRSVGRQSYGAPVTAARQAEFDVPGRQAGLSIRSRDDRRLRRLAAEAGAKQFAQRLSRRQECGALRKRSDLCRPLPIGSGQREIVVPVLESAVEPQQMRRDLNRRM